MDIRKWSGKRKVIALGLVLFLVVGIVVTILLVQMRQDTRSRAEAATILSLTPASQTVQLDDQVNLNVDIDPGINQIDFVKMVINFDAEKFDSTATTFTIDPNSTFKFITQPAVSEGQIVITLEIGSNPVDVIRTPQTVGTLSMKVYGENDVPDAAGLAGETQVSFVDGQTEVRSIGSSDTAYENVLSSTNPATIFIEAVCRPNFATCAWDAVDGALSYNYVITNTDEDVVISEGTTTDTFVDFQIYEGINYSCSVIAENECGVGAPGDATGVCLNPGTSPEPTATPSASPTLAPTEEPTSTPTPTVAPTATPQPTSTPTPTVAPTSTPIPTDAPNYTAPTPTPVAVAQATPTPLPPTGNTAVMVGSAIGGVLIILGGLALLML